MKLLTFFTNSHLEIYENYFLPSFESYLKNDFELLESHYEQICENGSFGSSRFGETMIGKLEHIIKNIDINDTQPLVYSDCDVQFFGEIKNDLLTEIENYDLKLQNDILCMCAGFFICKQNQNVLNFFTDVLNTLKNSSLPNDDDQRIINEFLNKKVYPLKYDTLPCDKYFTVAYANNSRQWNGEDFNIPSTILVHHANWTVGINNKLKLLEYVKSNR